MHSRSFWQTGSPASCCPATWSDAHTHPGVLSVQGICPDPEVAPTVPPVLPDVPPPVLAPVVSGGDGVVALPELAAGPSSPQAGTPDPSRKANTAPDLAPRLMEAAR